MKITVRPGAQPAARCWVNQASQLVASKPTWTLRALQPVSSEQARELIQQGYTYYEIEG